MQTGCIVTLFRRFVKIFEKSCLGVDECIGYFDYYLYFFMDFTVFYFKISIDYLYFIRICIILLEFYVKLLYNRNIIILRRNKRMTYPFLTAITLLVFWFVIIEIANDMVKDKNVVIRFMGYAVALILTVGIVLFVLTQYLGVKF